MCILSSYFYETALNKYNKNDDDDDVEVVDAKHRHCVLKAS